MIINTINGGAGGGNLSLDDIAMRTLSGVISGEATYIASSAFANFSNITEAHFPVASTISQSAFYSCKSLTFISFPSVKTISSNAFYNCSCLNSLYLPSVTRIEDYAFYSCKSLTELSNMSELSYVGSSAFMNCKNIVSIDLPACTGIAQYGFDGCTNLTSINIKKLTGVGSCAFGYCYNLSSVELPVCDTVGSSAFISCSNLRYVSIPFAERIPASTFYRCSQLTTVIAPGVAYIEAYAFLGTPITEFNAFGATIQTGAFESCPISKYFIDTIGSTRISAYAFRFCSNLSIFYIRNQSAYFDANCFSGCINLQSVYLLTSSICSLINAAVFSNTPISNSTYINGFGSIYVPESLYNDYITASIWSLYSDRFVSLTSDQIDSINNLIPHWAYFSYNSGGDTSLPRSGSFNFTYSGNWIRLSYFKPGKETYLKILFGSYSAGRTIWLTSRQFCSSFIWPQSIIMSSNFTSPLFEGSLFLSIDTSNETIVYDWTASKIQIPTLYCNTVEIKLCQI